MAEVLTVAAVFHRYGPVVALDGVDLGVAAGECVALLGPNGAGKTTVVRLATGLLGVQHGTVHLCGGDPRRAATRRHLGVVQQSSGFPRTLRVGELVRGAAVRAGRSPGAAARVGAEVGVGDLCRRRAATLSGGEQRRVQLAMALVGDPALLVLDEPTVGLDVSAQRAFWATLAARRDTGVGILLTTHVVEGAATFADRVVVVDRGRVVATGTPSALTGRLPDCLITARTLLDRGTVAAFPGVLAVRCDGDRTRVATAQPEHVLRQWLAADRELTGLRVEGAGLADALVALTGREGVAA